MASEELRHLLVQLVRKKEQRSVKAACRAKQLVVLEQESRAQAARLHRRIEVHVVLVKEPLRPGDDSEVVGRQADLIAARPWLKHRRTAWTSIRRRSRACRRVSPRGGRPPLTGLGVSDVLDRLAGVDPQVMEVPAVASSFPQFHHLETGRNFLDTL